MPDWGGTVVVICTGPSLNKKDLELVRNLNCIAVNDAYLVAPWAKILYAADARWWRWHKEGREKIWPWIKFTAEEQKQALHNFKGQKLTIDHPDVIRDEQIHILGNAGAIGLSEVPGSICTGQNSGYQAIDIAVQTKAKKILLLGMDMKHINNKSHAHNGHDVKTSGSELKEFAKNFSTMLIPLNERGIDVVNCSPDSALEMFRFSTVELEISPEMA